MNTYFSLSAKPIINQLVRLVLALKTQFAIICFVPDTPQGDAVIRQLDGFGYTYIQGAGKFCNQDEISLLIFPEIGARFSRQEIRELEDIARGAHQQSILVYDDGGAHLNILNAHAAEIEWLRLGALHVRNDEPSANVESWSNFGSYWFWFDTHLPNKNPNWADLSRI